MATVTDPLGNVSSQSTDAVGRITGITDALGNSTHYQYNNLNRVTQVTDAQGNPTAFAYDANGNLLSLTDALTHTTSYTYDNMDRVVTRTDPLLRQESYNYDLNGNLASATDRRGEVTVLSYDGINRMVFSGFNASGGSYESTISYSYDGGNRMTQAINSCATGAPGCVNGTIADIYDGLDRLLSETTGQGTISYQYDNDGRRTSMTVPCSNGVASCAPVTYTYDNANRLTQISQSSSNVSFGYDSDNRRTAFTLPNGVNVSYTYDNDSRVTGIAYKTASSVLGNLSYAYDQLGRRTQVGGSLARTGLPGTVSSASYDAANELTSWNGAALSYDANGNMVGDGSNAFTWNARNQVATLNNVSLAYDVRGRRIQNAAGTSFLYDGSNIVQELSGSNVTANLLSGGIDEVFTRSDSSGAFTQIKDALGSTIALADSNGNIQTAYIYDPYGSTSASGAANANVYQYTGRENEGNGLYYYRARYYSPVLHRFVSEDPLRFNGGSTNLYSYVKNDPTDLVDPSGKNPACLIGGLVGTIGYNSYVIYQSLSGRKVAYYGGWSGLGHILSGNATAFGAGCAAFSLGAGVLDALAGETPTLVTEGTAGELTSGQMGQIIGWGTGQSAAAVAETEAVTASLTEESVAEMADQGLTQDWVEEQLGNYLEAATQDSKLANTQLWPRIDLMNTILNLWPK